MMTALSTYIFLLQDSCIHTVTNIKINPGINMLKKWATSTLDKTVGGSCSGSPTRTSFVVPYCSGMRLSISVHWQACQQQPHQNIYKKKIAICLTIQYHKFKFNSFPHMAGSRTIAHNFFFSRITILGFLAPPSI